MERREMAGEIRRRRTAKGLSQDRLGAAIGVTKRMVQKYEAGAAVPRADHMLELARVLRLDLAAMAGPGSTPPGVAGGARP